jgi:hypothetical protein
MAYACAQAVAINFTNQLRLAVNDFYGALGACFYTLAASVTFFFIYFYYVS